MFVAGRRDSPGTVMTETKGLGGLRSNLAGFLIDADDGGNGVTPMVGDDLRHPQGKILEIYRCRGAVGKLFQYGSLIRAHRGLDT
jgi:hypothetical protein